MLPGQEFRHYELNFDDINSLVAFGTFGKFEFDFLALIQRFIAVTLNRAEMHENIRAIFRSNESITFLIAEPLDFTFCHFKTSSC